MTTKQLYPIYLKHPSICTDTRKISASCLFFALKGDNFDGNAFAGKALENGAAFAIIDDPQYAVNDRFILVSNVLKALQDLAQFHRSKLLIPIIGITGTNGKTTTKELTNSVLSHHCRSYATEGNLNNHIGVPLTLLSINKDSDIAIVEMGANHQNEIEFLCNIAQPTHGLITNVGKAHLEGFSGIEGVKSTKGELYDYLAVTGGTAFINRDNFLLVDMSRERNVKNVVYYGKSPDNYLSARLNEASPCLVVGWQVGTREIDGRSNTAVSNLPGIYNFENIVAAICIGSFFKLTVEQINAGISAYKPENNRSQILNTTNNTIICDYYNANPSSMMVALDNLETIDAKNKVMILGDMFELGDEAAMEHLLIIEKAIQTPSEQRIFIGEAFYKLKKNIPADFYRTTKEAYGALKANPIQNATVLIKGSRGMKLELLVELL